MSDTAKRFTAIIWRYGLSLFVILIAFFLTKLLWPVIQPAPVPLFFAAILAAFWGGFGPGLFASVISAQVSKDASVGCCDCESP